MKKKRETRNTAGLIGSVGNGFFDVVVFLFAPVWSRAVAAPAARSDLAPRFALSCVCGCLFFFLGCGDWTREDHFFLRSLWGGAVVAPHRHTHRRHRKKKESAANTSLRKASIRATTDSIKENRDTTTPTTRDKKTEEKKKGKKKREKKYDRRRGRRDGGGIVGADAGRPAGRGARRHRAHADQASPPGGGPMRLASLGRRRHGGADDALGRASHVFTGKVESAVASDRRRCRCQSAPRRI